MPSGPLRGGRLSCVEDRLSLVNLSVYLIMATTTKRADFEAIFPSLAQDIISHAKKYNLPDNALEWFEKVGPCLSSIYWIKVQLRIPADTNLA